MEEGMKAVGFYDRRDVRVETVADAPCPAWPVPMRRARQQAESGGNRAEIHGSTAGIDGLIGRFGVEQRKPAFLSCNMF